MTQVLAAGAAGPTTPLTFTREGTGTLFYTARLRYAADTLYQQGLDTGFRIERALRAVRRERHAAGRHRLSGRRSGARHADASASPRSGASSPSPIRCPPASSRSSRGSRRRRRDLAAQQDRQANDGGDATTG